MTKRDLTPRVILLAGLAAGLAALTAWAWLPIPTLLQWVPDDSFYYFQPASLLAQGYVPSMDGVHAGNGFNPLWMLLLTPIFALKPVSADLPVHLALMLSGILFLATGYVIYKILRELGTGRLVGAYGAATFALWPSGILIAADGETTPVNVLVLACMMLVYLRIITRPSAPPRLFLALGGLGGLAFLARTENLILLLLLGLLYAARRRGEAKAASLAVVAAGVAVFALPSLAWNYALCGTVLPISGWAVPMVMHNFLAGPSPAAADVFMISWRNLGDSILELFIPYSPLKIGIFVVYGFVAASLQRRDGEARSRGAVLAAFLTFVFVLYGLNAGVRWYLRYWHLGAALLVNHVFAWYAFHLAASESPRRKLYTHLAAGVFLAMCAADLAYTARQPWYPWQTEMLAAGKWVAARPQTRFGAFNAGIISYYGADNVADLDGNMDGAALDALKRRDLYAYCRRERVAYIVDYDESVRRRYADFWPRDRLPCVEVVSRALDEHKTGHHGHIPYYIYRIR